jgi:hypothetical protein
MKNLVKAFCVSLFLISTLWLGGCSSQELGQFMGQMAGAVVDGALAGLGNTEPDNTFQNLFGEAGAQAGLESEAQRSGVNLAAIPAEWKSPEGRLAKNDQGLFCYVMGDDFLYWDPNEKCWKAKD